MILFTDLPEVENILQESEEEKQSWSNFVRKKHLSFNSILRGHQNKEEDTAAIEGEDDSARRELSANLVFFEKFEQF